MSSVDNLIDMFKSLYNDIDSEIDQIKKYRNMKNKSEDHHKKENPMKDNHNIPFILNSAKKKLQKTEEATEKKVVNKRKSMTYKKSSFPPIWDDQKLNLHIQNVLADIMKSSDDESKEIPTETSINMKNPDVESISRKENPKDCIYTVPKNRTRNVATNVNFSVRRVKKESNLDEKLILFAKNMRSKIQKSHSNVKEFEVNNTNDKSFPQRPVRFVNIEKTENVNFQKKASVSTTPQKLAISAVTLTSTNGQEKPAECNNSIHIVDSNLVTNNTKQMCSVILPVLSIKSKCCIQNIYQFEISPEVSESSHKRNTNDMRNVKFVDIKNDSKHIDSTKDEQKSDDENPVSSRSNENREKLFVDSQDIVNSLNNHEVNIGNEKIQSDSSIMDIKRTKERKCRESGTTTINRRSSTVQNQQKPIHKKTNDKNEVYSSSSLTDDDRKLCDVLKFYDDINQMNEMGNKDENIFSLEDRYQTYPHSSNTSSNATKNNKLMTNEVKKANNFEYNAITESFQSIYKLIEDTFQSNIVDTESCENEKDNENGMSEMNQVIKMSEDNIRKAEELLQKYQKPKIEESRDLPDEQIKIFNVNCQSQKIDDDNNPKNTCELEMEQVKYNQIEGNDGTSMQCQNYKIFSKGLQCKMQKSVETLDFGVQTTDEKGLQTDENFDYKTRFYFKPIFDTFDSVNFDKSKFSPSKKIDLHDRDSSVPYNPIYSSNDEILKVANKFLRSIENERKRKVYDNGEESYYVSIQQEGEETLSSKSTPTSEEAFHNENVDNMNVDYRSNCQNELDYTYSEGEILSLGEIKVTSSVSDESSIY